MTAGEISQQLAATQVERPGGKAELDGGQQTVRTIGTIADAQALRDYSIALGNGRDVRLSALATITDGAADPTQLALLDGKPVVGFSLARSRGADELKVRDGIKAALEQLAKEHPGTSYRLVTDMSEETERSYSSSMTMLCRRRAAGAGGGVLVPARLARDLGQRDRVAAVDHPRPSRSCSGSASASTSSRCWR